MRFQLNDSSTTAPDRLAPLSVITFLFLLLALLTSPAMAFDFRFETENDFLTGNNEDDLYTFAVALEIDHKDYLWSLREKAFTDREGGIRFDETQLAVGRSLPAPDGWTAYGEIGVVRLGEGLFGEDAQNAVHRLIGDEEVELDYVAEGDLHGSAYLRLDKLYRLSSDLTAGPRLEAYAAPGFRTNALAALQLHWQGWSFLDVEAMAGARYSDSSLEYLEPHLKETELAAELGFVLRDRILLTWSYNDHGTGREHFSLGYRFGSLRGDDSSSRGRR